MIDGIAGDAFSATVLPPVSLEETKDNEEKVIRISRERYSTSRAEVEDKIARWSGMLPGDMLLSASTKTTVTANENKTDIQADDRKVVPAAMNNYVQPVAPAREIKEENLEDYAVPEPEQPKPERPMFSAECDTCGVEIQVPFKPDGKRPTFCKDCLKDYQRAVAKAKLRDERILQRQGQTGGNNVASGNNNAMPARSNVREEKPRPQLEKRVERKVFSPQEKPLTLSQLSNVAPKKFENGKKKTQINLDEVRNMINNVRNGGEN